jgi:Amino-transferase class IV
MVTLNTLAYKHISSNDQIRHAGSSGGTGPDKTDDQSCQLGTGQEATCAADACRGCRRAAAGSRWMPIGRSRQQHLHSQCAAVSKLLDDNCCGPFFRDCVNLHDACFRLWLAWHSRVARNDDALRGLQHFVPVCSPCRLSVINYCPSLVQHAVKLSLQSHGVLLQWWHFGAGRCADEPDLVLYTAPAAQVLPGTCRARVLAACGELGIPVMEAAPDPRLRSYWQQAFLCSAMRSLQPVSHITCGVPLCPEACSQRC